MPYTAMVIGSHVKKFFLLSHTCGNLILFLILNTTWIRKEKRNCLIKDYTAIRFLTELFLRSYRLKFQSSRVVASPSQLHAIKGILSSVFTWKWSITWTSITLGRLRQSSIIVKRISLFIIEKKSLCKLVYVSLEKVKINNHTYSK